MFDEDPIKAKALSTRSSSLSLSLCPHTLFHLSNLPQLQHIPWLSSVALHEVQQTVNICQNIQHAHLGANKCPAHESSSRLRHRLLNRPFHTRCQAPRGHPCIATLLAICAILAPINMAGCWLCQLHRSIVRCHVSVPPPSGGTRMGEAQDGCMSSPTPEMSSSEAPYATILTPMC